MIKASSCVNGGGGCTKTNTNLGLANNNPAGYYPYPPIPRYSITGTYTYLPSEPGFNTIIKVTGDSYITINYAPLYAYVYIYVNNLLVDEFPNVSVPGVYNVPAGLVDGNIIFFILKFNI